MTVPSYDLGDTRRLSAAFTISGNSPAATDPTTLTFKMREPDGTVTSSVFGDSPAIVVKDSTGNFHVDWLIAKVGKHYFRWIGTGAAAEADTGEFEALPGNIAT